MNQLLLVVCTVQKGTRRPKRLKQLIRSNKNDSIVVVSTSDIALYKAKCQKNFHVANCTDWNITVVIFMPIYGTAY